MRTARLARLFCYSNISYVEKSHLLTVSWLVREGSFFCCCSCTDFWLAKNVWIFQPSFLREYSFVNLWSPQCLTQKLTKSLINKNLHKCERVRHSSRALHLLIPLLWAVERDKSVGGTLSSRAIPKRRGQSFSSVPQSRQIHFCERST